MHKRIFSFLIILLFWTNLQMLALACSSNEVNLDSYIQELCTKIKKSWLPVERSFDYSIILLLTIDKDGNISTEKIIKSSQDKLSDEAALNAVQKANPYKPLPANFKEESLKLKYTLTYTINAGESASSFRLTPDEEDIFYVNLSDSNKKVYNKYFKDIDKDFSVYIPTKRYVKRKTVDVSFAIIENGEIKNIEIKRPSDSEVYDELVKSSLGSAKVECIPKELGIKELKVKYRVQSGTF